VVAETLNMHRLAGYTTGGTIHIIANNQIGFTTEPSDAYSTFYASGLARGFKIPIIHVNADDPVACIEVARLAWPTGRVSARLPDRPGRVSSPRAQRGDEPASRSRRLRRRSPPIRRFASSGPASSVSVASSSRLPRPRWLSQR
jgi:hypothetical protein